MRRHAPAPVRQDGAKVVVTTVTDKTGGSGKRARKTTQKHMGTVHECCREQWKVKLDQCDESQPCNGCEECVFLVDSSSDSWTNGDFELVHSGDAVVGHWIAKFFPGHGWFGTQIQRYDPHNDRYEVQFSDGQCSTLTLAQVVKGMKDFAAKRDDLQDTCKMQSSGSSSSKPTASSTAAVGPEKDRGSRSVVSGSSSFGGDVKSGGGGPSKREQQKGQGTGAGNGDGEMGGDGAREAILSRVSSPDPAAPKVAAVGSASPYQVRLQNDIALIKEWLCDVIGANGKTSKDEIEKVVANFKDEEITCRILATLSDEQFKELGVLKIGQREELRQRAASSDSPRDRDN